MVTINYMIYPITIVRYFQEAIYFDVASVRFRFWHVWMGSTRHDMQKLPKDVRRSFGVALFAVQTGTTPPIAKPLKGFGGAGVLELMEDDAGGTYRAVYTVRYTTAVYVLHVFQKKSKRGRAMPQSDIDLVELRLKRAAALHATTGKES